MKNSKRTLKLHAEMRVAILLHVTLASPTTGFIYSYRINFFAYMPKY